MGISINVEKLKKAKTSTTLQIIPLSKTDNKLLDKHLHEWIDSGVDEEIVKLNVISLAGKDAIVEHLNLDNLNHWQLQRRYKTVLEGGWVCQDRLKPDNPRVIKDKPVKYESPIGRSCEPILLKLPERIWQAIAEKYSVSKPPELDGWEWVKQNPEIGVVIAEGEKKAGCIISQTLTPAIALPGHRTAYEKDGDVRFKDFLHPSRKIIVCFDQDQKETAARDVARTIKGVGWRINPKGQPTLAKLSIARWWTHEKGIDDLWASQGQKAVISALENSVPWKQWVDTSFSVLGFEPDVQFNSPKWQPIEIPEDKHLIMLKGAKGTGKTWQLEQLCLRAKAENRPSIAITHRIQLSQALANRLGLVYINELEEKILGSKNISLCIDSLMKINPDNFAGGLIILDEVCQQLEHFLTGETCTYKRQAILKTLRKLASVIIETGGQFVIADADMNAATARFFMGLLGEEKPFIIENTYREPAYKCWLSNGFKVVTKNKRVITTPSDIVGVALSAALRGERIFIACTGQKEDSKWGSITIEGLFLKYGIGSVIRIDSDTVKDPKHPAFRATSKINQLCDSYQVVIGTPSVGTGVSIENQIPFNLVCGIFTGVGSPDAARQFLMRVRDKKAPRLIYCAERGLNDQFINLGHTEEKVSERIKELKEFQETCLKEHDKDWSEEYNEIKHCNTASQYFNNLIAARNNENTAFKNYVRWGLQSENVEVIDIEDASEIFETTIDFQALYNEAGTLSSENIAEYRARLKAQELLKQEEYEKLKAATELSEEERLALEATILSNKYGGVEVTEELIQKDSEGWYDKIKLHYACTVGYTVQKDIQALIANSQLRKGEGTVIQHDFIERQKLLSQVEFILGSEILDFIDSQHTFSKVDEESISLYQDMVEQVSNINLIFNQQINVNQYKPGKFNFQLIETIGGFIGVESVDIGRPKINGVRVRQYQIAFADDGRQEIFKAWLTRDLETQAKWLKRKKDWEVRKLIELCDDEITIEEFIKLQEHQLFNDAWEKIKTTTRIKLINRFDNYCLPKFETHEIKPNATNYAELLQDISAWDEVSLDIETFGWDKKNKEGLHPYKGDVALIQISNGRKIYYAYLGGREDNREEIIKSFEKFLTLLNDKCTDRNTKVIGQNIHFDLRFLRLRLGFSRAHNVVDTMKGAQIFFGDYGGLKVLPGGYGLGNLCEKLLGLEVDKTEQKSDWGAPLRQSQIDYAVRDPFVTYHLYKRLEELYQNPAKFGFTKLAQDGIREAWQLENDVIPCAVEIECNGVPIDRVEAEKLLVKCKDTQSLLLDKWVVLVPEVKYTQNSKLKEVLNAKYGLNIKSLNKAKLAELNSLPEVILLSQLRAIKIPIQQLESLLRSSARSGRIQTVFNTLTGTGRFSSGNSKKFNDLPNLQSISAKAHPALKEFKLPGIRTVVKPTGVIRYTIGGKQLPDRTLAVIDLAGAHGRIAADVANDKTAIAGNNDDSIDNHSKVAVHVAKALNQDVTWEEIKKGAKSGNAEFKLFRDAAKNTYYGWLNGAGAKRIQEQIKSNSGQLVALEACEGAIKGCEALYPQVVEFRKNLIANLSNKDNLLHIDGKYYAVNKISSVNNRITHLVTVDDDKVDLPYTQCLAAIWSRTEATALKRALVQITDLAETHPEWDLKVVNYVHDEINIEFNTAHAEEVVTTVNNIIGDCFQATMKKVKDGRETNWTKLIVENWSQK
jgi:hypothetical protein